MSRRQAAVVVMATLVATGVLYAPSAGATSGGDALEAGINRARASHGLPPLRRSGSLARSSSRFARRLIVRDVFGHASRIQASSRFSRLGEALAFRYGWRLRVRSVLRGLLGSPSHRSLLLSRSFRYVGAGYSRGRYGRRIATTWVVHVGAR